MYAQTGADQRDERLRLLLLLLWPVIIWGQRGDLAVLFNWAEKSQAPNLTVLGGQAFFKGQNWIDRNANYLSGKNKSQLCVSTVYLAVYTNF